MAQEVWLALFMICTLAALFFTLGGLYSVNKRLKALEATIERMERY